MGGGQHASEAAGALDRAAGEEMRRQAIGCELSQALSEGLPETRLRDDDAAPRDGMGCPCPALLEQQHHLRQRPSTFTDNLPGEVRSAVGGIEHRNSMAADSRGRTELPKRAAQPRDRRNLQRLDHRLD